VGAGVFGGSYETPVLVAGSEWDGVTAGAVHTCAWTTAGVGYCWGYNLYGVGDGTRIDRNSPTLIVGDHRWRTIAAGYANLSCGITDMNEVFCWGDNDLNSLGTGTDAASSVPVLVASP
jgi:alpha-tubulin suppressor-like RCC1 family protein